jgi:hypothetical protein
MDDSLASSIQRIINKPPTYKFEPEDIELLNGTSEGFKIGTHPNAFFVWRTIDLTKYNIVQSALTSGRGIQITVVDRQVIDITIIESNFSEEPLGEPPNEGTEHQLTAEF